MLPRGGRKVEMSTIIIKKGDALYECIRSAASVVGGKDELKFRPSMTLVKVSEEGEVVGTDSRRLLIARVSTALLGMAGIVPGLYTPTISKDMILLTTNTEYSGYPDYKVLRDGRGELEYITNIKIYPGTKSSNTYYYSTFLQDVFTYLKPKNEIMPYQRLLGVFDVLKMDGKQRYDVCYAWRLLHFAKMPSENAYKDIDIEYYLSVDARNHADI